jgi:hypothetical protein
MIVSINGKRACSVKLGKNDTRCAIIDWMQPVGASLYVGGADDCGTVYWRVPKLKIGDEVRITFVRGGRTDPPTNRKIVREERERQKKSPARRKANGKKQ